MKNGTQLSLLGLDIKKEASLADFFAPSFTPVLSSVYDLLHAHVSELYLFGEGGTGKTHLLSAIHRQYTQNPDNTAIFLSFKDIDDTSALFGLEMFSLILLDDIDTIQHQREWQEALFHLINRARTQGCKLIYTADTRPNELELDLPDLTTRLAQVLQFALPNGNEPADRRATLEAILKQKGWQLPESIKSYFVDEGPHLPGDMVTVLTAITPYFQHKKRKLPQKLFDDIKSAIKTQSLLVEIADIDLDLPNLPFDQH